MEGKKKEELTGKELEKVVGGATRRDVAADPRMRKRAADQLGGVDPPTKPGMDDYVPDPVHKKK